MIRHHMSFQNLNSPILAQGSYDIPQIFTILTVNNLSAVFETEHDMIFAPHLVCAKLLVCHTKTFLLE